MIDAVTELATATSASTAAAGACDDDDYDDTDSKNAIYATTKFEKSPAKSPEKVLDKSDSNTFFSYPGKGRTKFRSTLANLNDAAIIAIYGDNFESEPILQIRVSSLCFGAQLVEPLLQTPKVHGSNPTV